MLNYNKTDGQKILSNQSDSDRFCKFSSSSITPRVYTQFIASRVQKRYCINRIQIFPSRHSHGQSSGLSGVCILLYDLTVVLSICFNQLSRVHLLAFKCSRL